jgi:hypothetical protein
MRRLEILDCFTQPKAGAESPSTNEDHIVINPASGWAAVFDGISCFDPEAHEVTPGRQASLLAAGQLDLLEPDAPMTCPFDWGCLALASRLGALKPGAVGPGTVAAFVSAHHRKAAVIADIWVALAHAGGRLEILNHGCGVPASARVRAELIKAKLAAGEVDEDSLYDGDPAHETARGLVQKQWTRVNNADHPYGYGVICGRPIPPPLIKVFDVPPGAEIILASDGYPRLFPTWQQTEDHLQEMNRKDPHCLHLNVGVKGIRRRADGKLGASYDDRSYLRLRLNG